MRKIPVPVPFMDPESGQQKHSDLANTEHYIFFSNTTVLLWASFETTF
jgi:hypothetical protein